MRKNRLWKLEVEAIRQVLRHEWNPIGFPVPPDEYDAYIGTIHRMIKAGASVEELAAQLEKVETISIGLEANPEANHQIARRLHSLLQQALDLAQAAHPDDHGRYLRYIPTQNLPRIYAH